MRQFEERSGGLKMRTSIGLAVSSEILNKVGRRLIVCSLSVLIRCINLRAQGKLILVIALHRLHSVHYTYTYQR